MRKVDVGLESFHFVAANSETIFWLHKDDCVPLGFCLLNGIDTLKMGGLYKKCTTTNTLIAFIDYSNLQLVRKRLVSIVIVVLPKLRSKRD